MCSNNATLHFCKCFDNLQKALPVHYYIRAWQPQVIRRQSRDWTTGVWDEKIEVQKWQGPSESGRPASSSTGAVLPGCSTTSNDQLMEPEGKNPGQCHGWMLATALYENTTMQRKWHLPLACCSQVFNTFLHMASPKPHSDLPYRGEN